MGRGRNRSFQDIHPELDREEGIEKNGAVAIRQESGSQATSCIPQECLRYPRGPDWQPDDPTGTLRLTEALLPNPKGECATAAAL